MRYSKRLIGTMVEGFCHIEKKLDQMNRLKECMNGDRLLDNVDLAELLGVSQRTLARYRQEGKIKITRWKRTEIILSRLGDTEFPSPAW